MICKAEVRMIDFMVHYESDYGPAINFSVYPIVDCVNVNTGVSSIEYIDKTDDCWGTIEYFDENKCLKRFEGSYCWRGVWEGRLHFTDEEYWGGELSVMSDLYNNYIVPYCKNFIENNKT